VHFCLLLCLTTSADLFATSELLYSLLGSHTGLHCKYKSFMQRSSILSFVCLSHIRSRKLSAVGAKFRHLCRKSGPPSKNMTSDFALEVAKYPQKLRAYCLFSISDAACFFCNTCCLCFHHFCMVVIVAFLMLLLVLSF